MSFSRLSSGADNVLEYVDKKDIRCQQRAINCSLSDADAVRVNKW